MKNKKLRNGLWISSFVMLFLFFYFEIYKIYFFVIGITILIIMAICGYDFRQLDPAIMWD